MVADTRRPVVASAVGLGPVHVEGQAEFSDERRSAFHVRKTLPLDAADVVRKVPPYRPGSEHEPLCIRVHGKAGDTAFHEQRKAVVPVAGVYGSRNAAGCEQESFVAGGLRDRLSDTPGKGSQVVFGKMWSGAAHGREMACLPQNRFAAGNIPETLALPDTVNALFPGGYAMLSKRYPAYGAPEPAIIASKGLGMGPDLAMARCSLDRSVRPMKPSPGSLSVSMPMTLS